MTASWPATVPDKVRRDGYEFTPANELLESEMERGHKLRRIASGTPEIHKCRIRVSWAQLQAFTDWLNVTLAGGSLPFLFPHPITRAQKTCQFIPDQGVPYKASPQPGRHWFLDFSIRVYP